MNFFAISGLTISITSSLLGLFTIAKSKKRIHFQWFLCCASVAVWGFSVVKIASSTDLALALYWWRVGYIGVICVSAFYFHFIMMFLNFKKNVLVIFVYSAATFFLALNLFSNLFIYEMRFVFDQFYYIDQPSIYYNVFVTLFYLFVFYIIYLLYIRFKKSKGQERNQIRFFIFATILSFTGGAFAFLPVYHIDIYPFLNILVSAFTYLIFYAIFKHRLMDIKVVVQKGLIYSVLLSLIVGFYLFLIFFFNLFIEHKSESVILLAAGLTTIIGIYTAPIIEKFFRRLTDKYFFKEKYDFTDALYLISEELNKNFELEILVHGFIKTISEIMKIGRVELLLREKNKLYSFPDSHVGKIKNSEILFNGKSWYLSQIIESSDIMAEEDKKVSSSAMPRLSSELKYFINSFGVELFIAIILDYKVVGILMLGEKMSGDIYNDEDFKLLKTVSNQTAVAVAKAQLYEQVKNYSYELEKQVRQRTAKIRGLQEDQKEMMLEIAHGLQTPLTILKAELSMVRGKKIENSKIEDFERSLNRISKFIYDMLRLSKLESEEKSVNLKSFNLSNLLSELVESFEIIMQENNIELKYSIKDNIMLKGDRRKIEELITNLVSNSAKYMSSDRERIIKIKLEKEAEEIKIEISDTGIGIEKKNLDKLFKRFYRVENNNGPAKQGTGLGLAICKEIVDIHNGSIKVESEVGKGTRFIINFSG